MQDIISSILLILIGVFSIFLFKNKKNYDKLVDNGGESFANRAVKFLNIGGYVLLGIAACLFFFSTMQG
jgi:hypothetical protein